MRGQPVTFGYSEGPRSFLQATVEEPHLQRKVVRLNVL